MGLVVLAIASTSVHAAGRRYRFTTLAGLPLTGSIDAAGAAARFAFPEAVAVDAAGTIYVADTRNQTIRKVTPGGEVTTLAGLAGSRGSADGTGAAARFDSPSGVAVDGAGNVYVADLLNHTIRKITPGGSVSTLAGLAGFDGSVDGTGAGARFAGPSGVAVDTAGMVYVADSGNQTIRKITPAGTVSTLAGLAGSTGSADGTGSVARFSGPVDLTVDSAGFIYVADQFNHTIRKITPAGAVTTFAGIAEFQGSADGTGGAATFRFPKGLSVDAAGTLYVADRGNSTIRKITPAAVVTTFAGLAGTTGSVDGTGSAARFAFPPDVAVDAAGTLYVADQSNGTIRRIMPDATVSTLAGPADSGGSVDGPGLSARLFNPSGVTVDAAGNLYVADTRNQTIRKITRTGIVSTFAGLPGVPGSADGAGGAARFGNPRGVAVDTAGNVYVADLGNTAIRKITPAGVVTTLAGQPGAPGSADGTGSAARFSFPTSLAVDGAGNVFVTDSSINTIRKVTPAGVVTTVAGLANNPGSQDGLGGAARFRSPLGIAIDTAGNLYVSDSNNHTIRKITPSGLVSTLAGSAQQSGSVDGVGGAARFSVPEGIAVDGAGNVYVSDLVNNLIRKVTPAGVVSTVAGQLQAVGSSDGTGSGVRFCFATAIAADRAGNVFVADSGNNTIRKAVTTEAQRVSLDVDGDTTADLAVFNPASGSWSTLTSTTAFASGSMAAFGQAGDVPVPGDYDGDGTSDLAVYRPSDSTWRVQFSNGSTPGLFAWGGAADRPVPGDYDGDGRTDYAVYRPSTGTWLIVKSGTGAVMTVGLGLSTDIPVPADYDGDGVTDVAIYRPSSGLWSIRNSRYGRDDQSHRSLGPGRRRAGAGRL